MMNKFRLINSGGAWYFFHWKTLAKDLGLHSWFSRKGGGDLRVAWVSSFASGSVEGGVARALGSSNLP